MTQEELRRILTNPHFWRGYRQGFLIGLAIAVVFSCIWVLV